MGGGKGGGTDNTAALASMQEMNQQLMTQMMNMPSGLTADDVMAMMPEREEVALPEVEQAEAIDWTAEAETAKAKAEVEQKIGQVRRAPLTYLDDEEDEDDLSDTLLAGA